MCILLSLYLYTGGLLVDPEEDVRKALGEALTFHASFDKSADADFARGDRRLHTSATGKIEDGKAGLARDDVTVREGKGRHGGALYFGKKGKPVVFFRAEKNVAYRRKDWSGTVSFWLSLDPDKDLEPGYCDPIQITDRKWNDRAFFVDFTRDDKPRHFRLGVFADFKTWNPKELKWEEFPESDRPMVVVKRTPFGRGEWTHVVMTFSGFNRAGKAGEASLYLNGELQGKLEGKPQIFSWEPAKTAVMLGLSYIGLFDDLAIFNRRLNPDEVRALYKLPGGVNSLPTKR